MCDKKDGHIDMTAHISPQKQKLNPGLRKTVSFTKNQINQPRHTQTRRRKHKPRKPQTNSQATNPSSFLSGRPCENMDDFRQENAPTCVHRCPLTKPPSSPRDENFVFVTKYPQPEQTPPDSVAGQRADCRGRAIDFRQEIFQWETFFPIRCSLQRASPILNFRTEQSCKDESASPTT